MKPLHFRVRRTEGGGGGPVESDFRAGKVEKSSATSKLNKPAMETTNKVTGFINGKYPPITKWESDKTFEGTLERAHARKISMNPTNINSKADSVMKRLAGS